MIKMKMLITYSFEDDETRNSFIELLETLGCKNEPDQSTYSLPYRSKYKMSDTQQEIIEWSEDADLCDGDNICLYFPDIDEMGIKKIFREMYTYDKSSKSFKWRQFDK